MTNSIPPELMEDGDLENVVLSEACIFSSKNTKMPIPSSTTLYNYFEEDSEEEQEYL